MIWLTIPFIQTTSLIILGICLCMLIWHDFRSYLLPDIWQIPLLPLGLLVAWLAPLHGIDLETALWGAGIGGSSLYILRWFTEIITGEPCLGLGDVKFMMVAGAWTGWLGLPVILFAGSVFTLIGMIGLSLYRGHGLNLKEPVPFGPGLIAGFVLALIVGPAWIGYLQAWSILP